MDHNLFGMNLLHCERFKFRKFEMAEEDPDPEKSSLIYFDSAFQKDSPQSQSDSIKWNLNDLDL